MSVENAKAFIEKLNSDEALRNQIAQASSDEERLQLAREAGFDFTAKEFNSVIDEINSEELSEDELDTVAGGATFGGGESFTIEIEGVSLKKWKVGGGATYIDKSSPY